MRIEQSDVFAFHHNVLGEDLPDAPVNPGREVLALRRRLIWEEANELNEALQVLEDCPGTQVNLMASLAQEMVDLIYVVYGTAVSCGIDLEPIWDQVHIANMSKRGGQIVNGKLHKPQGWLPPNILDEIEDQMAVPD